MRNSTGVGGTGSGDDDKENVEGGKEDVFKVENPLFSPAPFSFSSGSSNNNGNNKNNYKTTSTGRIKEPREGHSRKKQKVLANYRKDMVFSLSNQGYNQAQISGILHVNQSLVCLTLQQLRKDGWLLCGNFFLRNYY